MIPLLTVARKGANLTFNSDGSVTDNAGAPTGSWSSASATRVNNLTFTPKGGAAETLPATYAINDNNQLTVALKADANYQALAAVAIRGFLAIEDRNDLAYYTVQSENPADTGEAFYVYGDISIDPTTNKATVATGAMGNLVIAGSVLTGFTALSASPGDNGLDLLEFSAVTHNTFDGDAIDLPASISLTGVWDIHDGQLKFAGSFDSTTGAPKLAIAIGGKLMGISAGFQLYSTGKSPQLLLTLKGEITGTNAKGDWSFTLGYARNTITATGQLKDTIVTPGGSLVLSGAFTVSKGAGSLTFDVSLNATWNLANGQISVSVKASSTHSYSLSISGKLAIDKNWNVSFLISKSAGGSTSFAITLSNGKPGTALNTQLQLYFDGHNLKLKANIQVSLTYVNGMLVPA